MSNRESYCEWECLGINCSQHHRQEVRDNPCGVCVKRNQEAEKLSNAIIESLTLQGVHLIEVDRSVILETIKEHQQSQLLASA